MGGAVSFQPLAVSRNALASVHRRTICPSSTAIFSRRGRSDRKGHGAESRGHGDRSSTEKMSVVCSNILSRRTQRSQRALKSCQLSAVSGQPERSGECSSMDRMSVVYRNVLSRRTQRSQRALKSCQLSAVSGQSERSGECSSTDRMSVVYRNLLSQRTRRSQRAPRKKPPCAGNDGPAIPRIGFGRQRTLRALIFFPEMLW